MSKISVIGAGSVGATVANDLMIQGVATEIVLVDINKKKAIGEALNHMPAILITGFIYGALVLLGSFVIVPGVYFGIAWGLYAYCIAFEDKKGWDALRASKDLVQGRWWKTMGYLFMLACIAMLWNTVFELLCSFMGESLQADFFYSFLS